MRILQRPFISDAQEQAFLRTNGIARPEYKDDFMFKRIQRPQPQRYTADLVRKLDEKRLFEVTD